MLGCKKTSWDFQKKEKLGWTGKSSFVLEVPPRHLRPSVISSVPCDRILQRPYYLNELYFCCYHDSYEIMTLCWRPDPSERPSFAELVTSLELQLYSKEVRNKQSYPRNDKIEIK